MHRSIPALVLVLFVAAGCARDASPGSAETDISIFETSSDETQRPDLEDTEVEVPDDSETEDSETDDGETDDGEIVDDETVDAEDVACPPLRAPLIRHGDVIDPCGCCAIGGSYCNGLYEGGSPNAVTGECELVHDAVPPCTDGIDPRGCPTHSCSGSCVADE